MLKSHVPSMRVGSVKSCISFDSSIVDGIDRNRQFQHLLQTFSWTHFPQHKPHPCLEVSSSLHLIMIEESSYVIETVYSDDATRASAIEEENVSLRGFIRELQADIETKSREIQRLHERNRTYLKVSARLAIQTYISLKIGVNTTDGDFAG